MTTARRNQWIFNTNSRRAYERKCQDCGQPVLVGLNDDTCAWGVAVEPPPFLCTIGLILARLNRRPLFTLSGKRQERRLYAVSRAKESDRVLIEHWCQEPPPDFWRQPPPPATSSKPKF